MAANTDSRHCISNRMGAKLGHGWQPFKGYIIFCVTVVKLLLDGEGSLGGLGHSLSSLVLLVTLWVCIFLSEDEAQREPVVDNPIYSAAVLGPFDLGGRVTNCLGLPGGRGSLGHGTSAAKMGKSQANPAKLLEWEEHEPFLDSPIC